MIVKLLYYSAAQARRIVCDGWPELRMSIADVAIDTEVWS